MHAATLVVSTPASTDGTSWRPLRIPSPRLGAPPGLGGQPPMRIRVPLEAGAGAPWRCEEQRFSAVAAHPLLGQPLLALDQHEEVTCTRREDGQTFARGCNVTGRNCGSCMGGWDSRIPLPSAMSSQEPKHRRAQCTAPLPRRRLRHMQAGRRRRSPSRGTGVRRPGRSDAS